MVSPNDTEKAARFELANRLFFRLYQCTNLLHKTGSRAVAAEGLTTQQWAVLGALSRTEADGGMGIGELARYLMVSRQNLAGVLNRMERDGRIEMKQDGRDRRSRLVVMTKAGRKVWLQDAQPKIHDYYADALEGFSLGDITHALHYLMKLLENMERIDQEAPGESVDE
ncbi:MarR family winged helix-turn-helix transcriptional regulator [Ramlibacter sp. MAHUQ-53]|uniref:MarR family winged helix-turn-helix transcriptional regulator n=1 Tax=unclassified Ramlibacter TaxID=2617605 RepID=UPI00362EE69A